MFITVNKDREEINFRKKGYNGRKVKLWKGN